MSLLLEALKKTGQASHDGTAQTPPGTPGAQAASSEQPDMEPARNSVRRLFAAKAGSVTRSYRPGLVPSVLLACTVLGAIYAIYVWYASRPIAAVAAVPVRSQSAAVAVIPPAPAPVTPTATETAAATPPAAPEKTTAVTVDPAPAPEYEAAAPQAAEATAAPRIRIESTRQPNLINPGLKTAYQSYREGDLAAAEKQYNAVLKRDPRNRDALLGMAGIARQQGQDGIAARYYQYVLALDPRDAEANAGMALLGQGDVPDTESHLKLLLAQQPGSAALNFALGNLYAGEQRWPEAQQAYFNAFSLQSDSAEYAFNLAVSLDHMGQAGNAVRYYRRALQLDKTQSAGFDHKQVEQRLGALKER